MAGSPATQPSANRRSVARTVRADGATVGGSESAISFSALTRDSARRSASARAAARALDRSSRAAVAWVAITPCISPLTLAIQGRGGYDRTGCPNSTRQTSPVPISITAASGVVVDISSRFDAYSSRKRILSSATGSAGRSGAFDVAGVCSAETELARPTVATARAPALTTKVRRSSCDMMGLPAKKKRVARGHENEVASCQIRQPADFGMHSTGGL